MVDFIHQVYYTLYCGQKNKFYLWKSRWKKYEKSFKKLL